MTLTNAYWNYLISLEKDFIRTMDFVELAAPNANVFGDNFAKLLLAIGSEIDVIAKAICLSVMPGPVAKNIIDYQNILTGAFAGMHDAYIDVVRTGAVIKPWKSWDPQGLKKSPDWWRAYNEVKHDRVANFTKATQENTIDSLAGLLVLNLYYYRNGRTPEPYTQLLDGGNIPSHIVVGNVRKMPGL
jgi:hypothetical protein